MSTATEHTLRGKFDEVAGKVKQVFGESTGNDSVANEGAAQQVKGHAEQTWGTVKGAAEDKVAEAKAEHEAASERRTAEHEDTAHNVRESVVSAAENLKTHVQNAIHGDKDRT